MDLIERCYPRVERTVRVCEAIGWIGVQALGLGLLNSEQLVRLTVRRFESSSYLDPSYNVHSGLWGWEREAISRFFPASGRILIGAAGSGREMVALHRAGYTVEGFECARTLVAAGQLILENVGCSGTLTLAPPGELPGNLGKFDGAIMGWSGYMYIPRRAQRVKLLVDFASVLGAGAPLLVSFQTRDQYERRMQWSSRVANWIRKFRGVEPVAVGDRLDSGFKHWFNREDIEGEMAEAGFTTECYGIDGYGWAVGKKAVTLALA